MVFSDCGWGCGWGCYLPIGNVKSFKALGVFRVMIPTLGLLVEMANFTRDIER